VDKDGGRATPAAQPKRNKKKKKQKGNRQRGRAGF
jgi:hypothetical protein